MISKGNHVKFARFVLLAVSEEAKTCLPGLLRWPSKTNITRHRKNGWRQGLTNTKRSTKVAKELFADYVKEKKLREPEEKKELAQTLKTCYVEARKKGFVQCIIKQLLDSVFNNNLITPTSTLIILDITKTSSNNCLLFRLVPAVVLTLELLKRKCPPFLFSQLKQLNLAPRSSR